MSSTVTTGRCAGAFRAPSGEIVYVLFEQTYETNCSPHTPHWCCVGIGEIRDVMQRIFLFASDCEGGMLRNRSGRLAPENYLRSWMRELVHPYLMPDFGRDLVLGTGFYNTVQQEEMAKARSALERIRRGDIADRLEKGEEIPVQLHQDAEIVIALYGPNAELLPPWLFIRNRPIWAEADRRPGLGFKPSPGAAPASRFTLPVVRAVGEEKRLIEQPDGSFQYAGCAYSIVSDFVENLWEEGLRSPKTCYQRIGAYRDVVRQAPTVDLESIRVIVDTTRLLESKHGRSGVELFLERYPVTKMETGFEVTPTSENLYHLSHLSPSEVRWLIPTAQPAFALVS